MTSFALKLNNFLSFWDAFISQIVSNKSTALIVAGFGT